MACAHSLVHQRHFVSHLGHIDLVVGVEYLAAALDHAHNGLRQAALLLARRIFQQHANARHVGQQVQCLLIAGHLRPQFAKRF